MRGGVLCEQQVTTDHGTKCVIRRCLSKHLDVDDCDGVACTRLRGSNFTSM